MSSVEGHVSSELFRITTAACMHAATTRIGPAYIEPYHMYRDIRLALRSHIAAPCKQRRSRYEGVNVTRTCASLSHSTLVVSAALFDACKRSATFTSVDRTPVPSCMGNGVE